MGLRVTASKTSLLFGCRYPFRKDVDVPTEGQSDAGQLGSDAHTAIEADLLGQCGPWPMHIAGYVHAARGWLNGSTVSHVEPAVEWDGTDTWHLGRGRGMYEHSSSKAVMLGTADVLLAGGGVVVDWKTTERSAAHSGDQLASLGTMLGARTVVAVEVRGDGSFVEHRRELDDLDRDIHGQRIKAAVLSIPHSEPTPGDHCSESFCPLRGACPAFISAIAPVADHLIPGLVPAVALTRRNPLGPIETEQDAIMALELTDAVDQWRKARRRELEAWVTRSGGRLDLPSGQAWREVDRTRDSVDAKAALSLAERLGARAEDIAEVTRTTKYKVWTRVGGKKEKSA